MTKVTECAEIADVIFTGKRVTNFVMNSVGAWKTYVFDREDDSAYYNQNTERQNKKKTVTQEAFMKWAGVTDALVDAANDVQDCCCLVAVHFYNSGTVHVQGIEQHNTGWRLAKKNLVATVNVVSDTGDNEDRVELFLKSTAKRIGPTTDLDEAAIDAL